MLHPAQSNAVRAILLPLTQFTAVHTIGYVSMDITMVADGNTWVAPSCALLCAPTQFLFDAVDDLSHMYLSDKWTGSIRFCCLPVNKLMVGSPLDKSCIMEVDICDYLGYSSSNHSVLCLYLDHEKYDKPHPSCATGAETIVPSNASFVTVYTSQSWWERREVHFGKMIASTWTRVVDARMEGHNQREPAPPRQSQRTVFVPLHSLSNGITLGSTSQWRRSTLDVPIMKITLRAIFQNFPRPCNSSPKRKNRFFNLWLMHAFELLLGKIMCSPNSASSSQRLK
jgi:hypothetical protein